MLRKTFKLFQQKKFSEFSFLDLATKLNKDKAILKDVQENGFKPMPNTIEIVPSWEKIKSLPKFDKERAKQYYTDAIKFISEAKDFDELLKEENILEELFKKWKKMNKLYVKTVKSLLDQNDVYLDHEQKRNIIL